MRLGGRQQIKRHQVDTRRHSQQGEPVSTNVRSFSDNVSREAVSFSNNLSRNRRCSQAQRRMFSNLLPHYIGRTSVQARDPMLQRLDELGPLSTQWHNKIREVSGKRAKAFGHYMVSMKNVFSQLAPVVRTGGLAIFVLGHSRWNGSELPTSELFVESAGDSFRLVDRLWYPIKNRYMSYGRRNKADINAEHVLVFRRTDR